MSRQFFISEARRGSKLHDFFADLQAYSLTVSGLSTAKSDNSTWHLADSHERNVRIRGSLFMKISIYLVNFLSEKIRKSVREGTSVRRRRIALYTGLLQHLIYSVKENLLITRIFNDYLSVIGGFQVAY